MKAAVYAQYGKPEVVQIKEVALPALSATKVLIRIYASTLNRTDTAMRKADNLPTRLFAGIMSPKHTILGCEYSGIVENIGTEVKHFEVGDKVFGFNGNSFGAHAEFIAVEETSAIAHMPAKYSFERAAALTEGAHYALANLRAAGVKEKQSILIYGATGAIGSAAVQLAKCLGAHVTAVAAGVHGDLVKAMGADHFIDYQTEDFTKTNSRFDYILDAVGKTSYGTCKDLFKKNGIFSSTELGKNSQNIFFALGGLFSSGRKVIFPIPKITKDDAKYLAALAQSGKYRPVIDRHFNFDDICEAHRFVETGQKIGNVVIRIGAK